MYVYQEINKLVPDNHCIYFLKVELYLPNKGSEDLYSSIISLVIVKDTFSPRTFTFQLKNPYPKQGKKRRKTIKTLLSS